MLLLLLCLFEIVPAVLHACLHTTSSFALSSPPSSSLVTTLPETEALFRAQPSASRARATLHHLTQHAHMAGTPEDNALAEYLSARFTQGLADEVFFHEVPAMLSFPRRKPRVALIDPSGQSVYEAPLAEDVLPSDATSGRSQYRNETFNGYAPSGLAVGRLVYANYGRPEDFAVLEASRVNVTGAVVLVRYGLCFRGLKVFNAQRRGAVGVLIYSDPADDGFKVGPVYPAGPWRSESSVQRGSVQFNSLCSGDPFRVASGGDSLAKCGYHPHELVPKVPVVPLSWGDALPLLRALEGPQAPSGFAGGLSLQYRLGPSALQALVHTDNVTPVRTLRNVVAIWRGVHYGTARDRPVVLGNHRDAWVFGAADPGSGTAAMLEMVEGFAALKRQRGWRPRRSIVVCSWSGEELGLIGSTALVEDAFFNRESRLGFLRQAVAYVNVDVGVAGPMFELSTTPSLAPLVKSVLDDVLDPATNKSLAETSWSRRVTVLGSGSDFAAFVHLAGVASCDMRFSSRQGLGSQSGVGYGTYHSVYDSFAWMDQFGDPTWEYHRAMATVFGLVALRLADARGALPFDHVYQARQVGRFVNEVKTMVSPRALTRLTLGANAYLAAAEQVATNKTGPQAVDSELNDALGLAERSFIDPKGLPGRRWFKHVLQAPGLYLGYAGEVLPGVRQAFEAGDAVLADEQAERAAQRMLAAAGVLRGGAPQRVAD